MSPRLVDGFVVVGDEAWLPEEWEAEQGRRRAAAASKMRARSAPGSVRPTVAGRGRPQAASDPEPVPIMDRGREIPQQEPPRQRSDWGHGGLTEGMRSLPTPLPAPTPAGVCVVNLPASTFALLIRSAMERAVADDFQAFPSEDQAAWRRASHA